ncbi:unnamed protein product, partial [Candidula unifasciata]
VPKQRRTCCEGTKCKKHTVHEVTQYKTLPSGYSGRSKEIVLSMECTECKYKKQLPIKQCKHFQMGGGENFVF